MTGVQTCALPIFHKYIREGSCGNAETDAAIRKRENANRHKRQMPVILNPFSAGDNA